MPAGFQTFTDGGLLQIDSAWRNMHLVHAGQGVLGTASMDAFHAAQARCSQFALAAWVFTGSIGGFPIMGEYVNGVRKSIIMRDGSPNQNAQWYLFDYTPSRSLNNYGLEVFTEAGCPDSCDHIPRRSWALFQAREIMRSVLESFKREQST